MKVLVTGGTGFIGGHLCRRLVKDGHSVRALVRDPKRSKELQELGVDIAIGDLRDYDSLVKAAEGIDIIYSFAAIFRQENVSKKDFRATNVQGIKNLLDAAVKAGVPRLAHCSSTGVYGYFDDPPATEKTPYNLIEGDVYIETKFGGEEHVRQYDAKGLISTTVFNITGVYGPYDTRFLKLFKSIHNGVFHMIGSGENCVQMIYIDDLIDGVILCGTHEKAAGDNFILTGHDAVKLNDLVADISKAVDRKPPRFHIPFKLVYYAGLLCEVTLKPLGIPPPLYRRRVGFFKMNKVFDISKARDVLGFAPDTNLNTGIRKTVDWYLENDYI